MTQQTAAPQAFGEQLFSERAMAYAVGQETANANGTPVAILRRDGWLAVCEEPPDDMESDPLGHGWTIDALIDPGESRIQAGDIKIGMWRDGSQEYRAAYVGECVLTLPEHASLSDADLLAEAVAEAGRADILRESR